MLFDIGLLKLCHTTPCKLKCNSNLQWVIKYHAVEHT